jgi:hypothetical protein
MTLDPTPQLVAKLRAEASGVYLLTVRGKRLIQFAKCRLPFEPPVTDCATDNTQLYLTQMLRKRAGTFLVQLADGNIIGIGTLGAPVRADPHVPVGADHPKS